MFWESFLHFLPETEESRISPNVKPEKKKNK